MTRAPLDGLSGVNVTVGLPFLRVSVDHGTAFDRAWKGIANAESMVEAIEVAVRMLWRPHRAPALAPMASPTASPSSEATASDPRSSAKRCRVLRAAQEADNCGFRSSGPTSAPPSTGARARTCRAETVDLCRAVDAILFGAAGLPDVRRLDGTEPPPRSPCA